MATIRIERTEADGASTVIGITQKTSNLEAVSALRVDAHRLFRDVVATAAGVRFALVEVEVES